MPLPAWLRGVGLCVMLFGVGHLAMALRDRAEALCLGLAGAGKIAFFALLATLWAAGELPLRAPMPGAAALAFGTMFPVWLRGGARA